MFVVWTTIYVDEKFMRKTKIVMNIRKFNKIIEFDVYSMFLQSDIISCIQKCKYISLMNGIAFFHQWLINSVNRHKTTIIIHRGVEQWNVAIMKFKNSSIHVQRQIDNHLRKYREFVKSYINDIMVFSKTLKKHLHHLRKILNLLRKMNIILKSSKTFLGYFTIVLFEQKIDSLRLIISKKKLKIIIVLFFFKILKDFETYFEMIEYLKNYISYYAQKAEFLQKRKTMLLKNESIKRNKRKNFSKGIILENSIAKKKNAFHQLQQDFSRSSWLIHFDKFKVLYADINASKRDVDVIVYHLKKEDIENTKQFSFKKNIDFIFFLNKILTPTETKYWPTKLKIAELMWTVRRIIHLIKTSDRSIILYTNHRAIIKIINQTKLSFTNIDKQNLKLMKTSMYLFQFRLKIRHRFEKFNIISNALNRLSMKKRSSEKNLI